VIHPVSSQPLQSILDTPAKQPAQSSAQAASDFAAALGDASLGFQKGQFPDDPWGDPSQSSAQPAPGAGLSTLDMSLYGRDALNVQAEANQIGNQFASMTGTDAANFTAQLPTTPSLDRQNEYDVYLAGVNIQRLDQGQPLMATDYWNEPPTMVNPTTGKVYTPKDLGWQGSDAATAPTTAAPTPAPAPVEQAQSPVKEPAVEQTAPRATVTVAAAAPQLPVETAQAPTPAAAPTDLNAALLQYGAAKFELGNYEVARFLRLDAAAPDRV